MNGIGKHSSLLRYGINNAREKFYSTDSYKTFGSKINHSFGKMDRSIVALSFYYCTKTVWLTKRIGSSGLYYKPMTIVNDNSRVVNDLEASLTDDAGVVIYDRHMFLVLS